MDDIWALYILCFAVPLIVAILVVVFQRKRLKEIQQELDLQPGAQYEVLLNNGNRKLGLTYARIGYGKKSVNGRINLYFYKVSKYRGESYDKEVMIKYENIWRIAKVKESPAALEKVEFEEKEVSVKQDS